MAEKLGALPLTDDPAAQRALVDKAQVIYQTGNADELADVVPRVGVEQLYNIQLFSLAVVSRLVPLHILAATPLQDIVEFRADNHDAFRTYHASMRSLAADIQTLPWEQDYTRAVLSYIEREVLPAVRELDDMMAVAMRDLWSKSAAEAIKRFAQVVAPSIPTMTIASFAGLGPGQLVLLGASSLLTGLGLATPQILDYRSSRAKRQRNGLSFLLQFRNSYIHSDYRAEIADRD